MDDRLDASARDHSVPADAVQDLSLGAGTAALKPTRALASAALLALTPLFGVKFPRGGSEWRLLCANALLTFSIPYGILYWAEQWVPSGLAAVLFATFPLLTAILAHFVLPGERLTPKGIVGILAGF